MNKFEDTMTKDLTQDNIEKLKEIFPECVKDNKIDFELLKQQFTNESILGKEQKFGFVWPGKEKMNLEIKKPISNTLIPLPDKSLNFQDSENIYIEGENLKVLKIMQKHYCNKIDVIYIDPPYNTGNDFIYNDDFSIDLETFQEMNEDRNGTVLSNYKKNDGGRKHSNWLSMMYPRLSLARNLLKKDGIIFISIDDNEYSRLKAICDEIFGEENFVSTIHWQKKNEGSGDDSKYLKNLMEYIIIYAKNINYLNIKKMTRDVDDGSYKFKDKYYNERGMYKLNNLDRASLSWSENLDYEIEINNKKYYPGGNDYNKWLNRKNNHAQKDWRWRWSKDKFLWGLENGYIEIKDEKIYSKQYQYVDNELNLITRESPFSNLIINKDISGALGTQELKNIFENEKIFDHPKPTKLIKFCLNLNKNKDALVLDFFSGSATTAHAVLDLNKEDGGNRKFILTQIQEPVDNNEKFNTICDIGETRIKKVIDNLNDSNIGFRTFEVSNDNLFDTNDQLSLFDISNKNEKNPLNYLFEIMINYGLSFDFKYEDVLNNKLFSVNKGKYLVVTAEIDNEIIDVIQNNINDSFEKIIIPDCFFNSDSKKMEYLNKLIAILENNGKNEDYIDLYVG